MPEHRRDKVATLNARAKEETEAFTIEDDDGIDVNDDDDVGGGSGGGGSGAGGGGAKPSPNATPAGGGEREGPAEVLMIEEEGCDDYDRDRDYYDDDDDHDLGPDGAGSSLPTPDEAKLDLLARRQQKRRQNRRGGGGSVEGTASSGTASSGSDGEGDDGDDDGEGRDDQDDEAMPLVGWSGSLICLDDAKFESSVARLGVGGGCGCHGRRRRIVGGALALLTIVVGLSAGVVTKSRLSQVDPDIDVLLQSGALHSYNDRGNVRLSSLEFVHGGPMPSRYTADGEDVSPPLSWSGLPSGTGSLVLLMDDHVTSSVADRHGHHSQDRSHWVVYDIPPTLWGFQEDVPHQDTITLYSEDRMTDISFYQGITSRGGGSHGYMGPDPTRKTGLHYYVFTLVALDGTLGLDPVTTGRGSVLRAMKGRNVLGYGKLVGTYMRYFDD